MRPPSIPMKEAEVVPRTLRCAATAAAATLLTAAPVVGQSVAGRYRIGVLAGVTRGDGGTGATAGVTFAYRLSARLLVEGDATYLTGFEFGPYPFCPPGVFCFRGGNFSIRRPGVVVTASLLGELPGMGRWLRPYLAAGAGYARFRREIVDWDYPSWPHQPDIVEAPVFTAGGGLVASIARRLAVRADARYQLVVQEIPAMVWRPDIPGGYQWVRVACSVDVRF